MRRHTSFFKTYPLCFCCYTNFSNGMKKEKYNFDKCIFVWNDWVCVAILFYTIFKYLSIPLFTSFLRYLLCYTWLVNSRSRKAPRVGKSFLISGDHTQRRNSSKMARNENVMSEEAKAEQNAAKPKLIQREGKNDRTYPLIRRWISIRRKQMQAKGKFFLHCTAPRRGV